MAEVLFTVEAAAFSASITKQDLPLVSWDTSFPLESVNHATSNLQNKLQSQMLAVWRIKAVARTYATMLVHIDPVPLRSDTIPHSDKVRSCRAGLFTSAQIA